MLRVFFVAVVWLCFCVSEFSCDGFDMHMGARQPLISAVRFLNLISGMAKFALVVAATVLFWLQTTLGQCPQLTPSSVNSSERVFKFDSASCACVFSVPFCAGQSWAGSYYCTQGYTTLDLVVTSVSGNTVNVIFEFGGNGQGSLFDVFHTHTHAHTRAGSYYQSGTYTPSSGYIYFTSGSWIWNPNGYAVVDIYGYVTYSAAGNSFTYAVFSYFSNFV